MYTHVGNAERNRKLRDATTERPNRNTFSLSNDNSLSSLSLPVFAASRPSMAHSINHFADEQLVRVKSGKVIGIAVVEPLEARKVSLVSSLSHGREALEAKRNNRLS